MKNILQYFRLHNERENYNTVIENIYRGVVFRGANLWLLIFAIFIASLGLNVNSPSVIIGAMLISPLMGPIIGIGLGMAINDIQLLKIAIFNLLFAIATALAASTLYFLVSPINDAHSEILARTSPNVYDVLIALFGGLAGMLTIAGKYKGNVLTGVSIATALMPPLCTAGYGLATLQFSFFFGALYLFIINAVFIAFATFLFTRFLKFPYRQSTESKKKNNSKSIVAAIAFITFLPSVYFAYDMVRQKRFNDNAEKFIAMEAEFSNNYLLKKVMDAKSKVITLTFGGRKITDAEIAALKDKLGNYNLRDASLEIQQGFEYLNENKEDERIKQFAAAMETMNEQVKQLQLKLDSVILKDSAEAMPVKPK